MRWNTATGMPGDLAGRLLEVEGRAMEQLERARDALEEVASRPTRSPRRPATRTRRTSVIVEKRLSSPAGVPVGFPRVAPGPVDAHPAFAARVLAGDVVLVVGPPRRLVGYHVRLLRFRFLDVDSCGDRVRCGRKPGRCGSSSRAASEATRARIPAYVGNESGTRASSETRIPAAMTIDAPGRSRPPARRPRDIRGPARPHDRR